MLVPITPPPTTTTDARSGRAGWARSLTRASWYAERPEVASAPVRVRSRPTRKEMTDADRQKRRGHGCRPERMVYRHRPRRYCRRPVRRLADRRSERPLRTRRPYSLAHAPPGPDHLGHRGRRTLPARGRRDRGDPARRPGVLRARREPLAR